MVSQINADLELDQTGFKGNKQNTNMVFNTHRKHMGKSDMICRPMKKSKGVKANILK